MIKGEGGRKSCVRNAVAIKRRLQNIQGLLLLFQVHWKLEILLNFSEMFIFLIFTKNIAKEA